MENRGAIVSGQRIRFINYIWRRGIAIWLSAYCLRLKAITKRGERRTRIQTDYSGRSTIVTGWRTASAVTGTARQSIAICLVMRSLFRGLQKWRTSRTLPPSTWEEASQLRGLIESRLWNPHDEF